MISFILNNQLIETNKESGISLLDFIRYEQDLPGTKIGCREGDCGACTVLEGTLLNGKVHYKSIVSCLTPLGNAHGKHIVTIEGINMGCLSPIQDTFVKNAATQCGFCTPGFVMSMTSHGLSYDKASKEKAIASISGNICRCTGYKSIEKAAEDISELLENKDINNPIQWLVNNRFLPKYFIAIPDKLSKIINSKNKTKDCGVTIAGGTDLMVQKAEEIAELKVKHILNINKLKGIKIEKGKCIVGASTTASEMLQSKVIFEIIPEISNYFKLVSSEPIRNMGTIGGNIVNASPIGDLSILLLALDAEVVVSNGISIPLKEFYLGYKKLALIHGDIIEKISFNIPTKSALINFEKVSKRTHLDIASVNSAIQLEVKDNRVMNCCLSAGGVSPTPLFLTKTSDFLSGKTINSETLITANEVIQSEISPISDIRGSSNYKRLLIRQLFFAHFLKFFPDRLNINELFSTD